MGRILHQEFIAGSKSGLGSSVADPCHFRTDPDPTPDPAIFGSDLQGGKFFCLLLFESTFALFFKKIKSHTEVAKQ